MLLPYLDASLLQFTKGSQKETCPLLSFYLINVETTTRRNYFYGNIDQRIIKIIVQ